MYSMKPGRFMLKLLAGIGLIQGVGSQLYAQSQPGNGAPIRGVHPAFEMETLRLEGFSTAGANAFEPQVTALQFMSDGTLLMSTISKENSQLQQSFLGHAEELPGYVYAIKNITTDATEPVEVDEVARIVTGLGMEVVDDEIYVQEYNALNKLVDNDNDGYYESKEPLWNNFVSQSERQWTFGPAYKDGYFYVSPGVTMQSGNNTFPATFQSSGKVMKISKDGNSAEAYAEGFRNPDGLFFGPEGELFTTDDQGTWRPSSGFIHVQEGGFHGHENFQSDVGRQSVNSITWMVHQRLTQSPHDPWYVTNGLHRGQVYVPEMAWNNHVVRVFLERVDGVYQGNMHHFTGDLLAGGRSIVQGPDGNYYIGCLGNGESGNWGWDAKKWGFHRLKPTNNVPFEMLAVRSMSPTAYEIEFTKPVQANVSGSNFRMEQFTFQMQRSYGAGNMIDDSPLNPTNVSRIEDGMKVRIEFAPGQLKEKYMTHIQLVNLKSESGENPWAGETWYQLNRFGPAEVPGCLDPNYEEYNADADYDPGSGVECINEKVDVITDPQLLVEMDKYFNAEVAGNSVELNWRKQALKEIGFYDLQGKLLHQENVNGLESLQVSKAKLNQGLIIIRAKGEGFEYNRRLAIN